MLYSPALRRNPVDRCQVLSRGPFYDSLIVFCPDQSWQKKRPKPFDFMRIYNRIGGASYALFVRTAWNKFISHLEVAGLGVSV